MNIAIIIPAHNEAASIAMCIESVRLAIKRLPTSISAHLIVVLDSCSDNTLNIVKNAGVAYLSCAYQCVGLVRDLGIRHAIDQGADWIACTDADSTVAADWLWQQINHIKNDNTQQTPIEMICGVVSIENWAHLTLQTRADYLAHYQDKMGHRHIHGANLSFNARSYQHVGGFQPLPCHEDMDLVNRFIDAGHAILWSNKVRVITSSRLQARANEGFAAFLANLENSSIK